MAASTGTRWVKCDLHLHTTCSRCFVDKSVTPEQWVARAIEQGLGLVAVTDHNDYRGIDPIMAEGARQGLTVFPGVEITCDTGKLHVLVIFDRTKNGDTVRDFLSRCDITSETVGDPEGTEMSVFEVCRIARKHGALVIPAHIDEYSGLNGMSSANLDRFFRSGLADALQVCNTEHWRRYAADGDREALLAALRAQHSSLSEEQIDRWRRCHVRAEATGLPLLTFSDDPFAPGEGEHGLWGIGSVYSWIQLENADLQGLRQALLAPASRVRSMTDSPEPPRPEPDFWIRSIEARGTTLNPYAPLHIELHPQLNCLIGGRNSGKSAVIRLLAGIYHGLSEGSEERLRGFLSPVSEDGNGILTEKSELELRFRCWGMDLRLTVTGLTSPERMGYRLFRIAEDGTESEEEFNPNAFRALMCARVCIDGEPDALAHTPGALLEHIDRCIPDMYLLQAEREHCMERLIGLAVELNAVAHLLRSVPRIRNEREWLERVQAQAAHAGYPEMIELRRAAAERMQSAAEQEQRLRREYAACLDAYERSLTAVRDSRTAYLRYVLEPDESYRMELIPGGSRSSLHRLLLDTLNAPAEALRQDLSVLEEALFGKKGSLKAYEALLETARDPSSDCSCLSPYFLLLLRGLDEYRYRRLLVFRPEDELRVTYRPIGAKKARALAPGSQELSAAVLTLLLRDGNEPLAIDCPEETMDSRILFEELVPKLKKLQQERQLIIATHSTGIAVNADPDMVIVMENTGRVIRVRSAGTIDSSDIRNELCDVLEGSRSAFEDRARKYGERV